jgi:hypothetical protein
MEPTEFTELWFGFGVRGAFGSAAAFVKGPLVASLDSRYHIFELVSVLRVCNTFIGEFSLQGVGRMDTSSAVVAHTKVFVVARNKHVVPKQRRIERLTAGYAVQEFKDDSQGSYWYVITSLEVIADQ